MITETEGYYKNTYDPWSEINDSDNARSDDLPWGDINIVVLTDVHSWIGGNHRDDPRQWPVDRRRESNQDASYGDVLSFYGRLQNLVEDHNRNQERNGKNTGRDIFFVMNGDFVDGTGLSGIPPIHLAPLLQHMPWDAINVGNHELYHNETIRYVSSLAESDSESTNPHPNPPKWKKGSYLSSNTLLADTNQPLTGSRYTYLEGSQTKTTILTFGFLFDFHTGGGASTTVPVRDAIAEDWFTTVLGDDAPREFDAILVLAHMDCLDPLIQVLLEEIRAALPERKRYSTPIQFVTGHTHRRCHAKLDANSESFEAGRFLDTIGFISFDANGDGQAAKKDVLEVRNRNSFRHRFLDANLGSLHETLVFEHKQHSNSSISHQDYITQDFDKDFGTPEGLALTAAIRQTEVTLGLDEIIGCASTTYGFSPPVLDPTESDTNTTKWISPYDDPKSVMHLYLREVIPSQLLESIVSDANLGSQEKPSSSGEPIFITGSGAIRYSLFEGQVTVNDVIAIDPYSDLIHEIVSWNETTPEEEEESQFVPIQGWELAEWLEAANVASKGYYGMPPFLLSVLPLTEASNNDGSPAPILDPQKTYRFFASEFDVRRLLSVTEELSFGQGRSFRSQRACRGTSTAVEDCYVHRKLWNQFIRKEMPCAEAPRTSTNGFNVSLQRGSGDDNSVALAEILPPPLSTASVQVQRRTTQVQEDIAPVNGQKAATVLVVLTVVAIAYKIMVRTVSRVSPHLLMEHAAAGTSPRKCLDSGQSGFGRDSEGSHPGA